jgi:integrase
VAKLTKRTVEAVKPAGRDVFVWDEHLPGFGLRVLPSGKRSYLIQYRAKGRTRRFALGLHGVLTPDQARRRAAELLAQVRHGGDPSAERSAALHAPTVADLCERYLAEYAAGRKKARSVAEDRRIIAKYVLSALGKRRVADIEHSEASRLHNALRATPVMANRVVALLSTAFNLAERWGLRPVGTNPIRGVDRFPERARERFLSEAELARLGEVLSEVERSGAESPEVVAALRLLVLTGCRVSEVLTLRWDDVDFERRCLRFRDSKTGPKVVPLNAPALEVFEKIERSSEWVFAAREGHRPMRSPWEAWYRMRERAGLEGVRMHDLRHSFASVGASSGHSLLVIGALLGHRRAATTQRYAHLSNDPVRSASESIGARIAAAMNAAKDADVVSLFREG